MIRTGLEFFKRRKIFLTDKLFYSPAFISKDPDLKSIRETERYREAVARARKKAAQLVGGQAKQKAALATTIFDRLIDIAGVFDYVASVERTTGKVALVSVNDIGGPGAADSRQPSISRTGKTIVFYSDADLTGSGRSGRYVMAPNPLYVEPPP